ncbi:MAG: hypothetical protein WCJ40_10600 [Planctomycetota bacterium]
MSQPFLADVSIRIACGLVAWSAIIPWRPIPVKFFRTQSLIALGFFVLGLLAGWSALSSVWIKSAWIGLVAGSYLASVAWGIGLPSVARKLCFLLMMVSVGILLWSGFEDLGPLESIARFASAFWLGSTLTAMLLGHYYLTAPAMSIAPLMTLIYGMFACFGVRMVTTLLPLILGQTSSGMQLDGFSVMWLGMRIVMGYAGTFLATYLSYRTASIRSTQSATGILYVALALLLFGELTSMLLGKTWGMTL